MDIDQKLLFVLETLEVEEPDEVKLDSLLEDIEEWDSIGVLSIISEVDDNFDVTLDPEVLENLTTVQQLLDLF